ncbi:MAG: thermonuclease family protein [Paracoccaceae bacterium]|jgi:endonuclease YncB( thermonuclease family)
MTALLGMSSVSYAITARPSVAAQRVLMVLNGYARVTDGDTLVIDERRVRLFGIDAPELKHPYGAEAKAAMEALCQGQMIQAQALSVDRYDRLVARCVLPDGRDLAAELVKRDLALDWSKYSGGAYARYENVGVRDKLHRTHMRQRPR